MNKIVLWITNPEAENPISTFNGKSWLNYNLNTIGTNVMSGKILCTQGGPKWIQLRNDGIVVLQRFQRWFRGKKNN